MSKPHVYNTEGVVLRSSQLGEADRLLTIFSPTVGKFKASARGVRKLTSKLAGHLDVLTRSHLTVAKGRGGLDTITMAETIQAFIPAKSSLYRISRAMYLGELVDALNPLEAPNSSAYSLLLEGLDQLGGNIDIDLMMRYIELHLLDNSGFLPELHHCVECHKTVSPGAHHFSPRAGGLICPDCHRLDEDTVSLSLGALKVLRYLSSSTQGSAMALVIPQPLHRELAGLLAGYLRYILEKEMRSLNFLYMLGLTNHSEPVGSQVGRESAVLKK